MGGWREDGGMDEWMNRWVDGCVYVRMDRRWIYGRMGGYMVGIWWVYGWMKGYTDGSRAGWQPVDGQMEE